MTGRRAKKSERSNNNVGLSITPLPRLKIILLGCIMCANQMSIWMIFTMLPFMVEYYFPYLSVKELGFRAGILGSAFSLGALFGNLMWGVIADRFGRRPALIFGLIGTIISSLLFGFAPSFWIAVLARLLWGFLNGNVGVGKTYMAEILDDSNNSRGMALFSVIAGVGRTLGPFLGGFLSTPAKKYLLFHGTIFETFPFALPSLVVSITCFFTVIFANLHLTETLRGGGGLKQECLPCCSIRKTPLNSVQAVNPPSPTTYSRLDTSDHDHRYDSGNDSLECSNASGNFDISAESSTKMVLENGAPIMTKASSLEVSSTTPSRRRITFSNVVVVKVIGSEVLAFGSLKRLSSEDHPVEQSSAENGLETSLRDDRKKGGAEFLDGLGAIDENDAFCEPADEALEKTDDLEGGNGAWSSEDSSTLRMKRKAEHGNPILPLPQKNLRFSNGAEFFTDSADDEDDSTLLGLLFYLLSRRDILLSTSLYGLNGFLQCIATEIFPLWVVTSAGDGGFGFDSSLIGVAIGISGIAIIFMNLVVYPWLVDRYGLLRVYRMGAYLVAATLILTPSVPLTRHWNNPGLTWGCLVTLLALYNSACQWVLTCVFTLINNSCYSHQRGTVNGIGQTFAAFGRFLGPYIGSTLFAWTETSAHSWPLNYALTWYLVAALSVASGQLAGFFSRSIQRRKREPALPRYAKSMRKRFNSDDENGSLLESASPQAKSKRGDYVSNEIELATRT